MSSQTQPNLTRPLSKQPGAASSRASVFASAALVTALALAATLAVTPVHAEVVEAPHVEVELMAEHKSIEPGTPLWLGLRLTTEPGWHTYWRNPGDSGLATRIKWQLPEGFEAGDIQWPYPMRMETPPFVSYGYEHEVVLLTRIATPSSLGAGETVRLEAEASWTVCREDRCIPGRADLGLSLPVRNETPAVNGFARAAFERSRAALPGAAEEWSVRALGDGENVVISLAPRGARRDVGTITAFEIDKGVIDHSVPARTVLRDEQVHVVLEAGASRGTAGRELNAVLVSSQGWDATGRVKALAVSTEIASVTTDVLAPMVAAASDRAAGSAAAASTVDAALQATDGAAAGAGAPPQAEGGAASKAEQGAASSSGALATARPSSGIGLALALAFAFAGGLILNLMPCVFPVLSLKVVRFVRHAHGHGNEARLHGWAFAAGVIAFFWALAGLLIVLRAGGEQLGWGFQLQSPAFVAVMCLLLFALGLNMAGVFELGGSLAALTGRADSGEGYVGSFASGALATVLATPCTAPFMGSALGWAAAQSATSALLVFTALGVGMASPYVLLAHVPALLMRLPRSGRWMETFKQAMAFPLFATVVWLVWVFGQQVGNGGVARLLGAFVLAAIGCWVIGRWGTVATAETRRHVAMVAALGFAAASVGMAIDAAADRPADAAIMATSSANDDTRWQPYDPDALARLRAAGKPVFIDFTAAWCLTCQLNERVAFTDEVWRRFEERGVIVMKADWTNRDETIAAALAGFGRDGVPLYVLYGSMPDSQPTILPQLLSPAILLEAIDSLS